MRGRCVALGALVAVLASVLLAAVIGLCFRFPVPFAGVMSGVRAVVPAMFGAVMYSLLGGAIVQALVGSIGGLIAYRRSEPTANIPYGRILLYGTFAALPGLLFLATLDWIIGPW